MSGNIGNNRIINKRKGVLMKKWLKICECGKTNKCSSCHGNGWYWEHDKRIVQRTSEGRL